MFGALLFLSGQMRIGSISSFILYSRKFSGPINEAANIMSELQSALAAAERVFHMMDEAAETADREDALALETVEGDVLLENVSFGYTKEQCIIKHLNLHAAAGKTGGGGWTDWQPERRR